MITAPGTTSLSVDIQIVDDTGIEVTGLVAATLPAISYSRGDNTAATAITLSDLAAITTAHANDNTAGGVKERASGWYRLDIPNNALTSAGVITLIGGSSGKRLVAPVIQVAYTQADVRQLLGTAWLTPGTAGTPDVNVRLISGDTTAADNAEAFFDGTGYAGTNNVIPTVTTLTTLPAITANWLTAAGIANDAITAEKIADGAIDSTAFAASAITADAFASGAIHATAIVGGALREDAFATDAMSARVLATNAVTEIQSGLSTLTAAEVTTAVWAASTRTLTAGTNIQLPSNALELVTSWTVNISGNLSGSVGSVSGNIGGNLLGTLSSTERDAIALAALVYDWDGITGEPVHCNLNAGRFNINAKSQSGSNLLVKKEDGTTTAFTVPLVSDASGVPVIGTGDPT